MNKSERIIELYYKNKEWSNKRIANEIGVSKRHVRRVLNPMRDSGKLPKILLFDIETLPCSVLVWGLYKQMISPDNVISDWACLGWSGKWLFDSKIISDILTPEEALIKNDKRIMESMWKVIDEADIVIAHNGDRFDVRRINARFLLNDIQPPSSYQTIDTMKVAKRYFAFSSYKLDYITKILGIDQKLSTSFGLWKRCLAGDSKALKEMQVYNKNDVRILEEVYLVLRPWIKSHPNVSLFTDLTELTCPNCGDTNLTENGKYYTPAGRFVSYRCKCGAISRSRYSDLSKEERENLLVSVAR